MVACDDIWCWPQSIFLNWSSDEPLLMWLQLTEFHPLHTLDSHITKSVALNLAYNSRQGPPNAPMGNITCNTVKTLNPPAIRLRNTGFSQPLVASQYFCDEMLATTWCGNALYKRAKNRSFWALLRITTSHYNKTLLSIVRKLPFPQKWMSGMFLNTKESEETGCVNGVKLASQDSGFTHQCGLPDLTSLWPTIHIELPN